MVSSTNPGWHQNAFDALMRLFGRVGLRKNVKKTVGMIFQLFQEVGFRADKVYKLHMMGEEQS